MPKRPSTGDFIEYLEKRMRETEGRPEEVAELVNEAVTRAKTAEGMFTVWSIIERELLEDMREYVAEEIERRLTGTRYEKYVRPSIRYVWRYMVDAEIEGLRPKELAERLGVSRSTVYNARWLYRKAFRERG